MSVSRRSRIKSAGLGIAADRCRLSGFSPTPPARSCPGSRTPIWVARAHLLFRSEHYTQAVEAIDEAFRLTNDARFRSHLSLKRSDYLAQRRRDSPQP